MTVSEIKIILKYFSNQTLDSMEKVFIDIKVVDNDDKKLELTKFGNNLKNELSLQKGILKRVKNLSSNEEDLNKLLSQIKEN